MRLTYDYLYIEKKNTSTMFYCVQTLAIRWEKLPKMRQNSVFTIIHCWNSSTVSKMENRPGSNINQINYVLHNKCESHTNYKTYNIYVNYSTYSESSEIEKSKSNRTLRSKNDQNIISLVLISKRSCRKKWKISYDAQHYEQKPNAGLTKYFNCPLLPGLFPGLFKSFLT